MDSLSFAIQNSSLNLNIKHIQQQKDGIEAELSTAQKTVSRYKNIGFGMIALIILWSLFILCFYKYMHLPSLDAESLWHLPESLAQN